MIPELRDLSYESRLLQCGLTTLETRRLRGDQIEVFKIVNGYEDVDRNMFFKLKEKSKSKVKVRSYIARYPVRRTAQSALHFTPWQTCSFQGHLNFSGKHSATLQLREDYSFTFPPLSVLPGTELWQRGVGFETGFSRLRVRPSNRYAIVPHRKVVEPEDTKQH